MVIYNIWAYSTQVETNLKFVTKLKTNVFIQQNILGDWNGSGEKISLSTGKLAPTSNLQQLTTHGHQVISFSFGNIV
jgi:hypothetical protein